MKTLVALLLRRGHLFVLTPVYYRLAIMLLLLPLTFISQAQTKLWDKTFGGNLDDRLSDLITNPAGEHLLLGHSRQNSSSEPVPRLIKIDNNGQKEWDKVLSGSLDEMLHKGLPTVDGGYLLGGTTGLQSVSDEFYQFWIVKTNQSGTKVWEKKFLGPGILSAMIATSDGGYLLGGTSNENKKVDKTEAGRGGEDFWLVKIDASGNKLWDKTLGGTNRDRLTSLLATSDGGYLLGGTSFSGQGGEKSEATLGGDFYGDYWVVKVDALGRKQWDKTLGGTQDDILSSLLASSDGGYLVAGSSSSGVSGNKSQASKGAGDYWVVKLSTLGVKLWDKTLGGTSDDDLRDLIATPDGNYLLGGSSSSGISGDKSQASRGSFDYWLLKINGNGAKIWDKTLGGNDYDDLGAMKSTQDGSYVLAGTSFSKVSGDKTVPSLDTSPTLRGDYWIVKLKEELPLTAQWNMRYGGTGNDAFTVVIKTKDGGYLNGGFTNSAVSGDISQSSRGLNDFWIVKSDAAGKKLWDKRFGGTSEDYLNTLIQTSDGGYLLGGSSASGVSGDKSQGSRGSRDFWIVKISSTGVKQWDKRYGGTGIDELKKVMQLSTGEYILAGLSNSAASGDKSQGSQGGQDYWLVKISSTGTKLWDKRYGGKLFKRIINLYKLN